MCNSTSYIYSVMIISAQCRMLYQKRITPKFVNNSKNCLLFVGRLLPQIRGGLFLTSITGATWSPIGPPLLGLPSPSIPTTFEIWSCQQWSYLLPNLCLTMLRKRITPVYVNTSKNYSLFAHMLMPEIKRQTLSYSCILSNLIIHCSSTSKLPEPLDAHNF